MYNALAYFFAGNDRQKVGVATEKGGFDQTPPAYGPGCYDLTRPTPALLRSSMLAEWVWLVNHRHAEQKRHDL